MFVYFSTLSSGNCFVVTCAQLLQIFTKPFMQITRFRICGYNHPSKKHMNFKPYKIYLFSCITLHKSLHFVFIYFDMLRRFLRFQIRRMFYSRTFQRFTFDFNAFIFSLSFMYSISSIMKCLIISNN